jgi:hypothetical protein
MFAAWRQAWRCRKRLMAMVREAKAIMTEMGEPWEAEAGRPACEVVELLATVGLNGLRSVYQKHLIKTHLDMSRQAHAN